MNKGAQRMKKTDGQQSRATVPLREGHNIILRLEDQVFHGLGEGFKLDKNDSHKKEKGIFYIIDFLKIFTVDRVWEDVTCERMGPSIFQRDIQLHIC
jgi:hypothetical protein